MGAKQPLAMMQEDFRLLEQDWELGLAERERRKKRSRQRWSGALRTNGLGTTGGLVLTSEDSHRSVNHTFNASDMCRETHLSCKPGDR